MDATKIIALEGGKCGGVASSLDKSGEHVLEARAVDGEDEGGVSGQIAVTMALLRVTQMRCDDIRAATVRDLAALAAHGGLIKAHLVELVDRRCAEMTAAVSAVQAEKLARAQAIADTLQAAVDELERVRSASGDAAAESTAAAALAAATAAQCVAHREVAWGEDPDTWMGLGDGVAALGAHVDTAVGWVGTVPPRLHACPAVTSCTAALTWDASTPPGDEYEVEVVDAAGTQGGCVFV